MGGQTCLLLIENDLVTVQKLLVLLTCLSFSIPSSCCDVDEACCVVEIQQETTCCHVADDCKLQGSATEPAPPCCDSTELNKVFVSNEVIRNHDLEHLHAMVPHGPILTTACDDGVVNCFAVLNRQSTISGRCVRVRLQSWLC